MSWTGEVRTFWMSLGEARWFKADPDLDAQMLERFQHLWSAQRQLPAQHFLGSAEEALAAVLLFDQFPRNMFRGSAEQFATDPLALAVAKAAIARGFDAQLEPDERAFLYMPFQHSEDIDDQRQSLLLFTRLGKDEMLEFARKHHDVIARFGRFPHRNEMLGRALRADELAAGDVTPF